MEAPPIYSVVAYWVDPVDYDQLRQRQWRDVTHYLLLDPTGPMKKSYHAWRLAGAWGKSKRVRIQLEVPGAGMLVTEDDYHKRYAEAGKGLEQRKMWQVLSS